MGSLGRPWAIETVTIHIRLFSGHLKPCRLENGRQVQHKVFIMPCFVFIDLSLLPATCIHMCFILMTWMWIKDGLYSINAIVDNLVGCPLRCPLFLELKVHVVGYPLSSRLSCQLCSYNEEVVSLIYFANFSRAVHRQLIPLTTELNTFCNQK